MKLKISVRVLTVLLTLMLSVPHALAINYLGQTKWTVTFTDSSYPVVGNSLYLTGGITYIGGPNYLFQGYATTSSSPNGPVEMPTLIISGSGCLVGDNLILTLSATQDLSGSGLSGFLNTGVGRVSLDKTTLCGTFFETTADIQLSATKSVTSGYSIGTITLTGPVINLIPGTGGATMLLLE